MTDGTPRDGTAVMALFCAVWLFNVPAHGLSLLVIARDLQAVLLPLTAIEVALDVVLIAVLSSTYGPVGAAWASVVTIAVSNAIVLPWLVRQSLRRSALRGTFVDGYARIALAAAVAAGCWSLAGSFSSGSGQALAALALTVVLGLPAGLLAIGGDGRALILRRVAPVMRPGEA